LIAQLTGPVLGCMDVHVGLSCQQPLQLILVQCRAAVEDAAAFVGIQTDLKAVEVGAGLSGSTAMEMHTGIIRGFFSMSRRGLLKPLKLPCTVKRLPTSTPVAFAVAAVSTGPARRAEP
jgi:hypothetical protein